jgi:hypothetical protein
MSRRKRWPGVLFAAFCLIAFLMISSINMSTAIISSHAPVIAKPEQQIEKIKPLEDNSTVPEYQYPQYIAPEVVPEFNTAIVLKLAKLLYGEGRGIYSLTEQAAIIWCVLNRVDAEGYGMGHSIEYVLTFANQFHGYDPDNPTLDDYGRDLTWLVRDVLTRWAACSEGRVLPPEYMWFEGDGARNYFYDAYQGGIKWDWSLPSPYDS